MTTPTDYELIIAGGGMAGLAGARFAGANGSKTLLIEQELLGGRGFHCGSSVWLETLRLWEKQKKPEWVEVRQAVIDLKQQRVESWKNELQSLGVDLVQGKVISIRGQEVEVETAGSAAIYKCPAVVVATGSEVRPLDAIPIEGKQIIAIDSLCDLEALPKTMLLAGSNPESLQWAYILRRFGVRVFLCHEDIEILSDFDPDLIERVEQGLRKDKVKFLLNKRIQSIFKQEECVRVTLDGGVQFEVETLVQAGVRRVDVDSLFSEDVKPGFGEFGEVLVNERMETTTRSIYAAGGVTRNFRSALQTDEEGRVAAANALGKKRTFHPELVTRSVQFSSKVASVGCHAGNAHHFGFRGIEGRSQLMKDSSDAECQKLECKLVVEKKSRAVVGGQAFGEGAEEVISMIQMAVRKGMQARDLAQISAPFGSPFEPLKEAAGDCVSQLNQE